MSFDNEQKKLLEPLISTRAVIHFPFFANTFPLGFHYFQKCKEDLEDEWQRKVQLHDWGRPVPVGVEKLISNGMLSSPQIFYASDKTLSVLKQRLDDRFQVREVFFTEYRPRMFFFHTDRHVFLAQLIRNYCSEGLLTSKFVKALSRAFQKIEIFTDIPIQALLVKSLLIGTGFTQADISVIENWSDIFSPESYRPEMLKKKIVRIYFYGAPVTAALKGKPQEFTPIPLEDPADRSELTTYVCVIADNDCGEVKTILDNLELYHRRLFEAAENQPLSLRNIWWTYNRYALWQQHNSVFDSPQDFARCLFDHHKDQTQQ